MIENVLVTDMVDLNVLNTSAGLKTIHPHNEMVPNQPMSVSNHNPDILCLVRASGVPWPCAAWPWSAHRGSGERWPAPPLAGHWRAAARQPGSSGGLPDTEPG